MLEFNKIKYKERRNTCKYISPRNIIIYKIIERERKKNRLRHIFFLINIFI